MNEGAAGGHNCVASVEKPKTYVQSHLSKMTHEMVVVVVVESVQ